MRVFVVGLDHGAAVLFPRLLFYAMDVDGCLHAAPPWLVVVADRSKKWFTTILLVNGLS